jgi:hypothetical protein
MQDKFPPDFPVCARPRDQGLAWLSTAYMLKKKRILYSTKARRLVSLARLA